VLVELSVMEQRYQAVLAVIQDGWKVVEVADRLGVSRQAVHAWIARYQAGGLAALADRSHRPASCPHLSASCIDPCKADNTPFWSPDGTLISFTRFFTTCPRTGNCGFTAIFTMRTDGSDLHQVTQVGTTPDQPGYEDYSPIWSPDGTQFAFQRFDPNKRKHAIFIVGTDGSGLRRITPWNRDATEPDWSPNGRWIAFRTHEKSDEIGDIGLVRPDGTDLHLITSGKGKWASCSFSPNGKRIVGAWPAGGLPGNADLWVMNLNGSHLHNLTKSAETWESAPDWGPGPK
jgi:TolB protein